MCVPLKTIFTKHHDPLPLQHMKKLPVDPSKKENIAQFKVVYMSLPGFK